MALENLEKDIMNNAKKEAKKIVSDAEKESLTMKSEAKERIRQKKKEMHTALNVQLQNIDNMRKTKAKMQMKQSIMIEKKTLIDDVYDQLLKKLEKNKSTIMKSLYQTARKDMAPHKAFVKQSDIPVAKRVFRGLRIEGKHLQGGFVLENKSGSQLVDYSYETILEIVRSRSIKNVSKELFGV